MSSLLTQIQTLFSEICKHDLNDLRLLYLSSSPLLMGIYLSLTFAVIVFLVSEFNDNYSQVDRIWGFLPTVHTAHYCLWAHLSGLNTSKIDLILLFTITWAVGFLPPFPYLSLQVLLASLVTHIREEGRLLQRIRRLSMEDSQS